MAYTSGKSAREYKVCVGRPRRSENTGRRSPVKDALIAAPIPSRRKIFFLFSFMI
jgi:hypothetical protein